MKCEITDIVKFNDNAKSEAAKWCLKHGITGQIINADDNCLTIQTALTYPIWAPSSHVDIVAKQSEAPFPDDLGGN